MKQPGPVPFSHVLEVAHLHAPLALHLAPDGQTRAAIATFAGLAAVRSFAADLTLAPMADGSVSVAGRLVADVSPICVVTLEAFDEPVETEIEARFAPPALAERLTKAAEEAGDEHFEPPDELVDGRIDAGALAVEFLILSLDPYPRKPGATFTPLQEAPPVSPFEKLKALKLGRDKP